MSSETTRRGGGLELHVVTPCARTGNLAAVARSIAAAPRADGTTLSWLVVLDDRFGIDVGDARRIVAGMPRTAVEIAEASGVAGHAQRNHALERVAEGWIVFVDDDNLLHPSLPGLLADAVRRRPDAGAVVFDQDLGDGEVRRAAPENVRVGGIDSAQLALERSFVGGERFHVYSYSADGILAVRLYRRAPERFAFVPEVACTYNALNPGAWGELPPGRRTLGPLPTRHTAASLHFHRSASTDDAPDRPGFRLVHLVSDAEGDRLLLRPPGGGSGLAATRMRSPLAPGRQRLRGEASLDGRSAHAVRLTVTLRRPGSGARRVADVELSPGERTRFSTVLEVPAGSELELECRKPPDAPDDGRAWLTVEGLVAEPAPARIAPL